VHAIAKVALEAGSTKYNACSTTCSAKAAQVWNYYWDPIREGGNRR
jgi:hypothetical protein